MNDDRKAEDGMDIFVGTPRECFDTLPGMKKVGKSYYKIGGTYYRATFPRLDPMTGGELPSREAELEWLSGFPTTGAPCIPVRRKETE